MCRSLFLSVLTLNIEIRRTPKNYTVGYLATLIIAYTNKHACKNIAHDKTQRTSFERISERALIFFIAVCEGRLFYKHYYSQTEQKKNLFYLLFGDFYVCVCVSTHLFCFLHCADFFLFGVCIAFRNLFYMWIRSASTKCAYIQNTKDEKMCTACCLHSMM